MWGYFMIAAVSIHDQQNIQKMWFRKPGESQSVVGHISQMSCSNDVESIDEWKSDTAVLFSSQTNAD